MIVISSPSSTRPDEGIMIELSGFEASQSSDEEPPPNDGRDVELDESKTHAHIRIGLILFSYTITSVITIAYGI